MMSRPRDRVTTAGGTASESIGALLTRLRLARGFSQLRVAERLCAASGVSTVGRHEVSRWEREARIPGAFWLGWLSVVLATPLDQLEAAVAVARSAAAGTGHGLADSLRLWRPPTTAGLLTDLGRASGTDPRELTHAWLAGPAAPSDVSSEPPDGIPLTADGTPLGTLETRLREDRRHDDLIGGADLTERVGGRLRAAIGLLDTMREPGARRRALRLVADYAQLAGWVHADAGELPAARRAYRVALRAAVAGSDRSAAAYVVGSLSHLSLTHGDPHEALLLARTGYAGAGTAASPRTRALLLHRVALAAARCGERRAAHRALADADRVIDRSDPAQEPHRLYWLDAAEVSAMTGRCWAVLGRPLRALPLLRAPRSGVGPRTAAVYGAWLARCYAEVGEVEQAARIARRATCAAVRAGSARAAGELRRVHAILLRHRGLPAIRAYEHFLATAIPHLPAPAGRGRPGGTGPAAGGAEGSATPQPDTVAL